MVRHDCGGALGCGLCHINVICSTRMLYAYIYYLSSTYVFCIPRLRHRDAGRRPTDGVLRFIKKDFLEPILDNDLTTCFCHKYCEPNCFRIYFL